MGAPGGCLSDRWNFRDIYSAWSVKPSGCVPVGKRQTGQSRLKSGLKSGLEFCLNHHYFDLSFSIFWNSKHHFPKFLIADPIITPNREDIDNESMPRDWNVMALIFVTHNMNQYGQYCCNMLKRLMTLSPPMSCSVLMSLFCLNPFLGMSWNPIELIHVFDKEYNSKYMVQSNNDKRLEVK
jgi:hypothetical protein